MAKGNSQALLLQQQMRGLMVLTLRDLWTMGAPLVASVRVVVTFTDGEQIAQERALNGWGNGALVPFGWWDTFNEHLHRSEKDAELARAGGNEIIPLYKASK